MNARRIKGAVALVTAANRHRASQRSRPAPRRRFIGSSNSSWTRRCLRNVLERVARLDVQVLIDERG
jgi:hypothetical protein